jgi:hypothetical protein
MTRANVINARRTSVGRFFKESKDRFQANSIPVEVAVVAAQVRDSLGRDFVARIAGNDNRRQ